MEIYEVARRMAADLAPLAEREQSVDALSIRLAQAHALGLADQLGEILFPRASLTDGIVSLGASEDLALRSH